MRKFRNFRLMFNGPEGEGGGGTPPAPAAPAVPPAPAPTPPAPVPTPPAAPAAPAVTGPETFSRDYVHELREEAKANRIAASQATQAAEAATAALAVANETIAKAEAEKANEARTTAVTSAAKDLADPKVLMDSSAFQAHIAEANISDAEALKAKISEFVEKNPHYKLQPTLPGTSGGKPGGGNQTGATTLEGAIAAAMNS